MIIHRDDSKQLSLDEIRAFLAGAEPVEFAAQDRAQVTRLIAAHGDRHRRAEAAVTAAEFPARRRNIGTDSPEVA